MTIKTRGVAFNLSDPDQKQLYDYTMNFKNYSAYVKRLIQRDMESRGIKPNKIGFKKPVEVIKIDGSGEIVRTFENRKDD